jgi:AraC family transcriptional regulator, arabinose operon regulatory protein
MFMGLHENMHCDAAEHGKSGDLHGQSADFGGLVRSMRNEFPERRPEGFPGQRLVIVPPAIVVRAGGEPITRDLCVTHLGAFSAAGGHHVERPHGTSQHILIACISGSGSCQVGGGSWRLGPGGVLFLPPRERHVYSASAQSPWTIFWLHFRGLRVRDYLAGLGVSSARPVVTVGDPAVLTEAFEDTFRHTIHGFGPVAMIGMATAFARLLGVVHVHRHDSGARSRMAENRILKVLARMRGDLAHPWTLEELASAANLGCARFTELCRLQTGMPPLGLLIRLRLQRAMDLLQQGRHNVAEAAAAVGYGDPFYFSRLFRKHMGMPPSACLRGP